MRLRQRLTGLAAALVLAGIIVGLPVALLAAGNLPHSLPSLGQLRDELVSRDDGTLVLTVITVIGWAAWAYLTAAIILEIGARLRGIHTPHLPGFHLSQNTARGLVSTAMLLFVALPAAAPSAHATTITHAHTTSVATAQANPGQAAGPETAHTSPTQALRDHPVAAAPSRPSSQERRYNTPDVAQETVQHTVRHGESLWSIAEQHLGDGRRFAEIVALNSGVLGDDPGFLRAGTVLNLPAPITAASNDAKGLHPHTVTVEKGDTLSEIAEEELGDASKYPEIAAASRGITQPGGAHLRDPNLIYPGWTMNLPPATVQGEGAPKTADRPGTLKRREPSKADRAPAAAKAQAKAQAKAKATEGTSDARTPTAASPSKKATTRTPAPALATAPAADRTAAAAAPATRPATPANSDSSQTADTTDTTDTAPSVAPWVLTGLTGGGGVLAGSMMLLLRRRRRAQFRARRPGRTIATPEPRLTPVEKTLTAIGSTSIPAVEHLDQVLRRLATDRIQHELKVPEVAAVQLTDDTLTLHLSTPATLAPPWNGSADEMHWSIATTAEAIEQVGPLVVDQPAPYPLLVTIGQGPEGEVWLLNVEDLTVNITGDLEYGRDFARYLVAEIACNPWSHGVQADLVGVATEVAAMNPDRVRVHDHGDAAAEVLADAVTMIDRAQDAGVDVSTARAAQLGADTWPARLIIIDADAEQTPALNRLLELVHTHAGLTGTSVVVRGERDSVPGVVLNVSSNGRVTMPTSGLDLVAVGLTSDEAQGCAALLAQSDVLDDVEIPADDEADGWRAWSNEAGALRLEHTLPRDREEEQDEEAATSLLEGQDEEYVRLGATTRQDLDALAPKITPQISAAVLDSDPSLDQDMAAWWASDCPLPRLSLLGPVGATTRGTPVTKRKPYFTEVLAFLSTRAHGATPEELAEAFNISPGKARDYANIVRSWLGTNPRTGQDHLPDARKAPAAQSRGVGVYEVVDLLRDVDLFRRLRTRGEARGSQGIDDLDAALRLVQGRPFDRLRPGGWSWLAEGDRLDHHMICAIVDVAHLVTTHSLHAGDLRRARLAAETAALAAPDEEIPRLDLAAVANAEGHTSEAQRLLREQVYNRTDDDDMPTELSDRTQQIIAGKDWAQNKNTRQAG